MIFYLLALFLIIFRTIKLYWNLQNFNLKTNSKVTNSIRINKIKFILVYLEGDNLKECLESLLELDENIEITIIGKNININRSNIQIINKSYSSNLVKHLINKIHQNNDIIGVFRSNTLFEKNLLNKIVKHYQNNNCNKLFVLSNIISSNNYLVKYNFFNQLNNYASDHEMDYFTNNTNNKNQLLKNFLITKIVNLNSYQFCFHGLINFREYFILFFKYLIIYLYPSTILFDYFLQLIRQLIIIYSNLEFNQALEVDLLDIYLGNLLVYFKDLFPTFPLKIKAQKIYINKSYKLPEQHLIKKIEHGSYLKVKDTNLEILHLYGNRYQQGFAQGKLCQHHFQKMVNNLDNLCSKLIPHNPLMKEFKSKFDTTKECLIALFNQLKPYIGNNHLEEIKGISDGSNIPYDDITAITLIPELYHQHCMLLSKLDKTSSIFLRTLDFFFFEETHLLKIYHNLNNNSFCELGIPGSLWTMTAVSEKLLCIGETSGTIQAKTNLEGTPFYFYFKDILEKCNNLNEAEKLMYETNRNNNLFIMISSLHENKSKLFESSDDIKIYDTNNFKEYFEKYSNPNLNIKKDVLFEYGNSEHLNNVLLNFDDFSLDNIKSGILRLFRTGGNHMMLVNSKNEMFIQFNGKTKLAGFERDIYYFNLYEIFNYE